MSAFAVLLRGRQPGWTAWPPGLAGVLSGGGAWVRLPELRRRIRSWYDGGDGLQAGAWELAVARYGLATPEEHQVGMERWHADAKALLSLPANQRPLRMTSQERELAARLSRELPVGGPGRREPYDQYTYFSTPPQATEVFPRDGLRVALDDVHRALWDTAGLAAASPPSETFVRHLESCRSRSRADPSFHRFLGEVRDTLQRPQLTDASERRRTLDAVRRVFYRALKEAAYRRAGEYIMAWYPQWLARLGVIRVGGSPGAVDLSRRSVTPRRSARERLLDEQVLERMFMDVPAAYHWTTLEESWIELAKPPLFDVSRLTRRALPRPAQTSEPDRNMVAVALELALADVSPTVPHHASPLLHGKAESAAVDRFFASAAEYWFDELAPAVAPRSDGLWTPPSPAGDAPPRPGPPRRDHDSVTVLPPVLTGASLEAVLNDLEVGEFRTAPDWLFDPATNHEVVLNLGDNPNVPSRTRGGGDGDSARQLVLTENYVKLAIRTIVEEPGRRLTDEQLRGMFHGLNIALFGLANFGHPKLAQTLVPLLNHLVSHGHHGPFVPLIARSLSIGFSKEEDFRQAERAAYASLVIHKAAYEDWRRRRSWDGDEFVNLLEAQQQARLATSGLCLRMYEQEVISYRYLQDRRGRSPKDPLLMQQLRKLLDRARHHALLAVRLITEDIQVAAGGTTPTDKHWARASTLAWHTNARVMLLRAYLHLAHLLAVDGKQDAKVDEYLQEAAKVSRELTRYRLLPRHVNELVRFALQYAFLTGMRILPVSERGVTAEAAAGAQLPDFLYRPSDNWHIFDADAAAGYLTRQNADAGILVSLTHPGLREALARRSMPTGPSHWNDEVDPYRCWYESNRNFQWLARRRDVGRAIAQLLIQPDHRLQALPIYVQVSHAQGRRP